MPSEKLQQIALEFHIDLADMTKIEAGKLCEYISDFLLKNYNIINCDYKISFGE